MTERSDVEFFTEDNNISKAIKFINKHYNININNQTIANEIGLDASYFIKLFKKRVRMTPHQYLLYYRMYIADSLLALNTPVNTVAEKVGIDPKMFSRTYKALRGHLPSKFAQIL
jgi:YesN/AraC family two-component response regulator